MEWYEHFPTEYTVPIAEEWLGLDRVILTCRAETDKKWVLNAVTRAFHSDHAPSMSVYLQFNDLGRFGPQCKGTVLFDSAKDAWATFTKWRERRIEEKGQSK